MPYLGNCSYCRQLLCVDNYCFVETLVTPSGVYVYYYSMTIITTVKMLFTLLLPANLSSRRKQINEYCFAILSVLLSQFVLYLKFWSSIYFREMILYPMFWNWGMLVIPITTDAVDGNGCLCYCRDDVHHNASMQEFMDNITVLQLTGPSTAPVLHVQRIMP